MLNERIVKLRKSRNITQEELAKKIGATRSALSQYEIGTRSPDYDTLKRIADYFEVSTDYLLGKTDQPHAAATTVESIKERKAAAITTVAEKFGFDLTKEEDYRIIEQLLETASKIRGT